MAAAKKPAKRNVAKKPKPGVPKAGNRAANKAAKTARQRPGIVATSPQHASSPPPASSSQSVKGLRVRMFRVGFGDFFLLTVSTAKGDKHILIDCGVHAKDLGSIKDAVDQMASDCGKELALVIMTHRHADHISGFGTCSDVFSQITVDRVWMPWFEKPDDKAAAKIQQNLTAMASQISLRLAARGDPASDHFISMANNITGCMAAAGATGNQKGPNGVHNRFKNKPRPAY